MFIAYYLAPIDIEKMTPRETASTLNLANEIRVSVIDLKAFLDATFMTSWRLLAEHCETPNPFYAPIMLSHAHRLCEHTDKPQLLTVWHGEALLGLLPVEVKSRYGRVPITHLQSLHWRHRFLGEPLVRKGAMEFFVDALFAWLDGKHKIGHFINLPLLYEDSPFTRQILRRSTERTISIEQRSSRAYFDALDNGSIEDHLHTAQGAGTRKKLRAKKRKLELSGQLKHELLTSANDLPAWLDEFMRLEHKGWKGEAGTSLLSDHADANFFRLMTQDAFGQQKLIMARLRAINDEGEVHTLASSIDITMGQQQFALKIAHDTAYEAFSPGVLHEVENLRQFHALANLHKTAPLTLDSCASPDHPVLDRLYGCQLGLIHVIVGRATGYSKALVSSMLRSQTMVRKMRNKFDLS